MSIIIIPRNIGPVSIDCFLQENHESTCSITNNPIEDGSSVNDHAYLEPKLLSIEIGQGNETATDTYNQLVAVQSERQPFDIVSGLATYQNVMIENISVQRDVQNSKILRGSVSLREVRIVGTESLAIGAPQATVGQSSDAVTADRVAPETQRGDNQTTTVTDALSIPALSALLGF